jgi:hypothetical protein
VDFIKDEGAVRKKLKLNKNNIAHDLFYQEKLKILSEINQEKILEVLAKGPTDEDIENKNILSRNLVLETLKMGDIFPSYYTLNHITLDVDYITDSPSELICFKLSDLEDLIPVLYFLFLLFLIKENIFKLPNYYLMIHFIFYFICNV